MIGAPYGTAELAGLIARPSMAWSSTWSTPPPTPVVGDGNGRGTRNLVFCNANNVTDCRV
jgi:hypothetical protein